MELNKFHFAQKHNHAISTKIQLIFERGLRKNFTKFLVRNAHQFLRKK